MIKLEKTQVVGWEPAIRGMRNPKNSWEKSDSDYRHILCSRCENCMSYQLEKWEDCDTCEVNNQVNSHNGFMIGPNDHDLMMRLAKGGSVHAKYRRMIVVYVDITAPLYWWKEFDTYKVGTVANSCSTMHKIAEKPFTVSDISMDMLCRGNLVDMDGNLNSPELKAHYKHMTNVLASLNNLRDLYLKTGDKKYWRCMIEMLPSSYNQKRTVMLNYEVLAGLYPMRKYHKLKEWHDFCSWIEELPYSEIILAKPEKEVEEHNPLAHPETYVDDCIAMFHDMTNAQRRAFLETLMGEYEDA